MRASRCALSPRVQQLQTPAWRSRFRGWAIGARVHIQSKSAFCHSSSSMVKTFYYLGNDGQTLMKRRAKTPTASQSARLSAEGPRPDRVCGALGSEWCRARGGCGVLCGVGARSRVPRAAPGPPSCLAGVGMFAPSPSPAHSRAPRPPVLLLVLCMLLLCPAGRVGRIAARRQAEQLRAGASNAGYATRRSTLRLSTGARESMERVSD